MPSAILGPIAGSVVGGLMGGDDEGPQQTATKEPWKPTQRLLTNSLNTGEGLERYYQQNPFNVIQQTAYQNLLGDIDSFRGQNAGVMDFANSLMGTNYSRSGSPGQMGGMSGLMSNGMRPQQGGAAQGLAGLLGGSGGMGSPGPFSVPQGRSYGLLDFTALNPFTSGAIPAPVAEEKPPEKTPEDLAREEWERRRISGEGYRGEGA